MPGGLGSAGPRQVASTSRARCLEREAIAERTRDALQAAKARGSG